MKRLEFWFCFLIVGAILFIIGRVPLAEAAVQQLVFDTLDSAEAVHPAQGVGTGLSGSFGSLTIKFLGTRPYCSYAPVILGYPSEASWLAGYNNYVSYRRANLALPCSSSVGEATHTISAGDFLGDPVVFNPSLYYVVHLEGGTSGTILGEVRGSGIDVFAGGQFCRYMSWQDPAPSGCSLTVKDMYFDLQVVSPAPPASGVSIDNLEQFKSDATSTIPEGSVTTEGVIVFGATLQSSSTEQLQLQVEAQLSGTPFTNRPTATSAFIDPGGFTTTTVTNLPNGQYHWQARATDSQNNASGWQEFGTAGNVDFTVVPLGQAAADLAKLVINGPYLGDGDTFGGKGWDPVQAEYVTSSLILNGYQYWNNKLKTIAFGAGLDCSGLTQWTFNRSFDPKKSLTRNAIRYDGADGQYKNNTETVTEANLQQGDLLFLDKNGDGTKDHVAMYVGDNGDYDIVEAFSPERGIIPSNITEFKTRVGFDQNKHIRRVVLSPSIGGQVKAGSPIDLAVTDPDGFTLTPTTATQTDEEYLREIPGELYYTENVLGLDGRPEDIVYWPEQKTGDYTIQVLPENNATPTETYSVEFTVGGQMTVLASDVPLSQIPPEGYGVSVTESGTISTFIPVAIDIKPDSFPNSINLGSKGTVPVAIFGSNAFDIREINLESITLANAPVKPRNNGKLMISYEDVNGDNFTDAVIHIITTALQLTSSDTRAELSGFLLNGREIKGSDAVKIVP